MEKNNYEKLANNEEKKSREMSAIFRNLPEIEPGGYLYSEIIAKIYSRKTYALKRKAVITALFCVLSIVVLVYFWSSAIAQINSSETASLFRLIFSDFKTIVADWKFFILYFLEIIPVMPIIFALTSTLVSMLLLKIFVLTILNKKTLIHAQ